MRNKRRFNQYNETNFQAFPIERSMLEKKHTREKYADKIIAITNNRYSFCNGIKYLYPFPDIES